MGDGGYLAPEVPLSVVFVLACAGSPSGGHLTLAGSSTLQPLLEVAGQAFEASREGVEIDVQGGGSSVGISAPRSGLAHVGMVSRPLKPEESDLTATAIALDGIALIVHASNPLPGLTREQVVDIYGGKLTSWTELGGEAHHITVVNKEEGRATLELFEQYTGLKGKFRPDAVIIGPNGQAITTVAGNPDAIAYVSIGSAAVAESSGTPIRRIPLDGVPATPESVSSGAYPLSRPLNLVTVGPPSGLAAELIVFLHSPEGQALVVEQDFIPVSP
jgi:phosphate transport system substrate-binding protein